MTFKDPEGFRMLVRGVMGDALGGEPTGTLQSRADAVMDALEAAWIRVEAHNPNHTYPNRSYGGGGGGRSGGKPKSPDDVVTFGKYKDDGKTWRELAENRVWKDGKYGPEGSRAYVEFLLKTARENLKDPQKKAMAEKDGPFLKKLLEDTKDAFPDGPPDPDPQPKPTEDTPF